MHYQVSIKLLPCKFFQELFQDCLVQWELDNFLGPKILAPFHKTHPLESDNHQSQGDKGLETVKNMKMWALL
jgi:hypothetical protein